MYIFITHLWWSAYFSYICIASSLRNAYALHILYSIGASTYLFAAYVYFFKACICIKAFILHRIVEVLIFFMLALLLCMELAILTLRACEARVLHVLALHMHQGIYPSLMCRSFYFLRALITFAPKRIPLCMNIGVFIFCAFVWYKCIEAFLPFARWNSYSSYAGFNLLL